MTNDEAVRLLEDMYIYRTRKIPSRYKPTKEALKKAIEALRHQQITQAVIKVDFSEEDKRQLVEEIVEKLKYGKAVCIPNEYEQDATEELKDCDERKKGKWIYHIDDLFPAESTKECDQCRTHQDLNCDGNFCPWCGAKMKEE